MPHSGQRLGEYVIDQRIGAGAFGEVWKAHHHAWTDQIVAVKIPTNHEYVRGLQREGTAVRQLTHPNIVKAIAFDPFADPPYLVMEYVPGVSLRTWLERGPLPVKDAVAIITQVLEALREAHSVGVIHRDIKPENILLHERGIERGFGTEYTVKLADFGLGKSTVQAVHSILFSQDNDGRVVGTPAYIAPEQLEGGEVDARADLYACGVVLFEMLTGKRPVGLELPSEFNSSVPRHIDDAFRSSFARLDKRVRSADELIQLINRPISIHAPIAIPDKQRHRFIETGPALQLLCIVFVALLVVWIISRASRDVPSPQVAQPQKPIAAPIIPRTTPPRPRPRPPAPPPPPEPTEIQLDCGIALLNKTKATEAATILNDVAAHYPNAVQDVTHAELVAFHDASEMQRHAGGPTHLADAYSAMPIAGRNDFIMLFGIYEQWPPARYVVVYRVQSLSPIAGENICFLDVCSSGTTVAERRPAASEFAPRGWTNMPVVLELKHTMVLEYRLWPNGNSIGLDRVYVFKVQ